jgi:hypothetical protein
MPVIAHSIPDSLTVSRTAALAVGSPRSSATPGRAQLLFSVRRISRICWPSAPRGSRSSRSLWAHQRILSRRAVTSSGRGKLFHEVCAARVLRQAE